MPYTLLAVLLAFAAPAPLAESSPIVLDDEAIVEITRCGKPSRRVEPPVSRGPASRPPRDPILLEDPPVPAPSAVAWTPRLFSRPPPF